MTKIWETEKYKHGKFFEDFSQLDHQHSKFGYTTNLLYNRIRNLNDFQQKEVIVIDLTMIIQGKSYYAGNLNLAYPPEFNFGHLYTDSQMTKFYLLNGDAGQLAVITRYGELLSNKKIDIYSVPQSISGRYGYDGYGVPDYKSIKYICNEKENSEQETDRDLIETALNHNDLDLAYAYLQDYRPASHLVRQYEDLLYPRTWWGKIIPINKETMKSLLNFVD
jgi:hypothetical protein